MLETCLRAGNIEQPGAHITTFSGGKLKVSGKPMTDKDFTELVNHLLLQPWLQVNITWPALQSTGL